MRKSKAKIIAAIPFIMVFLLVSLGSCSSDNEEDLFGNDICDTENVSYAEFIAPTMQTFCNSCHSAAAPSAGIITATYEGLRVIALDGRLVGVVNHEAGYPPMPQGQPILHECVRLKIRAWVEDGALNN
jgi:hypothetical protein